MKEIGSSHKIPLSLFFRVGGNGLSNESVFLSTGRDCLEYIIQSLKLEEGDVVMLPSYLCPEMLVPFKNNGLKIRFYKVDKELNISPQDFMGEICKGDVKLALIINYFGFIQESRNNIKYLCEQYNVVLVEDWVHCFLSDVNKVGDITFNSYRKSLPVPDGACIDFINLDTHLYTPRIRTRFWAGILKNFGFLKKFWRPMFIKSEKSFDWSNRPAKMSKISKYLLKRIDLFKAIKRRRSNFQYLLNNLKIVKGVKPLYDDLPEGITPFGFPIICEDRDKVKEKLIKNKIYPPIHWELSKDIDKKLFPDSHWLSERILTIPIDQRYGIKDMKRIVECLKT